MKSTAKQLAIIACGMFLLAGCSTTPHARAWEYKTLITENQDGAAQLNALGKEGWILVGFTFSPRSQTGLNNEYHYVFTRLVK
jgi:hypothetical protein